MARKRQTRARSTRNGRRLHKPRDGMSRRFTRGGVIQVRLSEVPAIVAGSETQVAADIPAPLVALVAERCPTGEDRLGPSAKDLASCGVAAWTALPPGLVPTNPLMQKCMALAVGYQDGADGSNTRREALSRRDEPDEAWPSMRLDSRESAPSWDGQ